MERKKHILITSAWFPTDRSTSGVFVKEQAEALARGGYRVTMVAVTYATLYGWLRGLFRAKPVYDRGTHATLLHAHVTFVRPARFMKDPLSYFKSTISRRVVSRLKAYAAQYGAPDLVHHHCLSDNAYIAAALAEAFRIPYVFTEHSNYFTYEQLNKFNRFETFEDHRQFLAAARERIAVSGVRAKAYEKIFGVPFICVPNMVDRRFEVPMSQPPSRPPFVFVCAAILDKRKRQDLLLQAFAARFRDQPVLLKLVGNGPMEQEYKSLCHQLKIDRQVEFTGKVNREEILQCFDAAHAVVLSSEQETFGVVLAEAMFRGRPVVSTISGGPEEVVTPASGFLCPKNDSSALAEVLQQMVDRYNEFHPEEIRREAMARYAETEIVAQLVRIYDSL